MTYFEVDGTCMGRADTCSSSVDGNAKDLFAQSGKRITDSGLEWFGCLEKIGKQICLQQSCRYPISFPGWSPRLSFCSLIVLPLMMAEMQSRGHG